VIISASYRTDIPAFYADWLFRRLEAGYCLVRNPYSGRLGRVDLTPAAVSGVVFWTRNFGPILERPERMAALRRLGRPWVVQYTVSNYPRSLEAAVIAPAKAIDHLRRLAGEVHPLCPVWRYDPVVTTSQTTPDFHRANFECLASRLERAVDEVVISFAHVYRKTEINLNVSASRHGFSWDDPPREEKLRLAADLAAIAAAHGMRLTLCTQPEYLAPGIEPARCVDARRLEAIAGWPIPAATRGNRPGCLCHQSRDIGDYDTCPHGCAYCYAVRNQALARHRYRLHDPAAETLVPAG
jgi:hypothetical protein